MVRRLLLVALVVLALVPAALADDVTPTVPPPPVDPSLVLIPDGVSIEGVLVGGMTSDQAKAAVQAVFDQPLYFHFHQRTWWATPERLGGKARLDAAVAQALASPPGASVDLVVTVHGQAARDYVAYLDRSFSHPARDSAVKLVKLRPQISKPRLGLEVEKEAMTVAIVRALRAGERGPLELEATVIQPKRTPQNFGPIIVIRRGSNKLYLYKGERLWRKFGVATGQAAYPTPLGRYRIAVKWRNPWWYPPPSPWAKDQKPVPPGPGNPLGTRWMGLTAPYVGIHGTPDSASIGYSASHGCIRMLIPDAEWLFDHVGIATPVFIVAA